MDKGNSMKTKRSIRFKWEGSFFMSAARTYVFVDGENVGYIQNGSSGSITLDTEEHELYLVYAVQEQLMHDVKTRTYLIPANELDYYYHIRFVSGFLRPNDFSLEEDYDQKRRNDNQLDIVNTIDAVFSKILQQKGIPDYSPLASLSYKYRESDYYKRIINSVKQAGLSNGVKLFYENVWSIRTVIWSLKEILKIPEYKKGFEELLRHEDYFCANNGAINSILPVENPISVLLDLDAKKMSIPNSLLLNDDLSAAKIVDSDDVEELENAVRIIVRCDYNSDDLDALKKWLLYFGSFKEGLSPKDAATYQALKEANQRVFSPKLKINDSFKVGKTVDMLIAEAMRCSYSGSYDVYDKDLEEFLKYTCPYMGVEKEQYEILICIFKHLGAYKEEKMVLQAMVDNMIERTPEQETRLVFLRDNDVPSSTEVFKTIENDFESGQFIYERRTLTWDNNEIKNHFASHSMQGRFQDKTPYVVAEWSKTINSSIKWDTNAIANEISKELTDNYDDELLVGIIKTASNGDWIEYEDTIAIYVNSNTSTDEFRWLAFNVIGRNINKKQINVMVQALYWPGSDINVIQLDDIYNKNTMVAKKITAIKDNQYPRWNIYINSIVDIAVGEIEKWINSSGDMGSIY